MPLTFKRFLEASGGRFIAPADQLPEYFRPSTDSRTLQRGDAFVCLHGDHFDGHDHIDAALAGGCSAVVIDDERKSPRQTNVPVVRVEDTKAAYLAGAAAARAAFGGRVVAITGSNGKTTTKEMAAQLIGSRKRTIATPANENNELGVAKLCYRLKDDVDVAVCEFGARHPGEIAQLVAIARPSIGVLTNIGEAHLEFFRDQEELARTKFAIFSAGAQPVCNAADAWTRMLAAEARLESKAIWARLCGDPQATGISLEAGVPSDGRVAVTFGASHAFAQWQLPGDHNLRDALLACGAAILSGIEFADAIGQFGALKLPAGRFEEHRLSSGATLIYDAYNASPTSMRSALTAFMQIPAQRHIAVLGSMAELGSAADSHHEATGAEAARSGVDVLLCGGEFASALVRGARDAGLPQNRIQIFESNEQAAALLRELSRPTDCVLLKGSRAQHMEQILAALLAQGCLAS